MRARWESPDGAVSISVLTRRTQTVQRTLLQARRVGPGGRGKEGGSWEGDWATPPTRDVAQGRGACSRVPGAVHKCVSGTRALVLPLQVSDVSQWGTPEEAAKLVLPRGAALLGSTSIAEARTPKATPVGQVELPPRNYYLWVVGVGWRGVGWGVWGQLGGCDGVSASACVGSEC